MRKALVILIAIASLATSCQKCVTDTVSGKSYTTRWTSFEHGGLEFRDQNWNYVRVTNYSMAYGVCE